MKYFQNVIAFVTAKDVNIALLFFVLGLISSWWVSSYFYEKSLGVSKISAMEAKRENQLILRGIESIGTIKYSRDSSGKIMSVQIELNGKAVGNARATGTLTDAP